jgi:hypothetical protein
VPFAPNSLEKVMKFIVHLLSYFTSLSHPTPTTTMTLQGL